MRAVHSQLEIMKKKKCGIHPRKECFLNSFFPKEKYGYRQCVTLKSSNISGNMMVKNVSLDPKIPKICTFLI